MNAGRTRGRARANDSAPAGGGAPATGSANGLWLALFALVALYALARMGLQPPAPKPADAPATEFSAGRALAVLEGLIGDRAPHPAGSAAHEQVRAKIVAELSRLGYEPQLQETFVRGPNGVFARVTNVLARRPGAEGRGAVLLCAHYDSVAAGAGAGDDGAGVGALLEIARVLSRDALAPRPVIFLFDDAEEMGLIGAQAFAAEHPWAAGVDVVVNLEARGTSGPSMMFETSDENLALMQVFAHAVARPVAVSAAYEVYKRMPNDTDLTVFKAHGMRGFNFAFIGGLRHYHTPLDDLAHLSPRSLQHHGDNALALVRALATTDFESGPPGRAVYTDVFGSGMIVWPENASIYIALLGCAVLCFAIFRRVRTGELRVVSIALGGLACLACVAAAAIAGWGVTAIVLALRAAPDPWAAHPEALRLAVAASTLAAALLVSRSAPAVRAGFEGLFLGSWSVLALAGAALAAATPSACYLLVIPSALAALCAAAWSFLGADRRAKKRDTLVLGPLVPLGALWFPLAIGIELSFEFHAAAAIALVYGILLAAVLPGGSHASARHAGIAVRGAVALCLGALCAALAVPAYSAEQPEALNLVHLQDADLRRAGWSARAGSLSAPSLARLAPLDAPPPPGWLAREDPQGAYSAPTWDVAAPELVVVENVVHETGAAGRRVRARLRSVRGARMMGLELPPTARLVSVTWRDHALGGIEPGDMHHFFVALGVEALDLELDLAGTEPTEVQVYDVDSSLPPAATPLLTERPLSRVPRAQGDGSIVCRRVSL